MNIGLEESPTLELIAVEGSVSGASRASATGYSLPEVVPDHAELLSKTTKKTSSQTRCLGLSKAAFYRPLSVTGVNFRLWTFPTFPTFDFLTIEDFRLLTFDFRLSTFRLFRLLTFDFRLSTFDFLTIEDFRLSTF